MCARFWANSGSTSADPHASSNQRPTVSLERTALSREAARTTAHPGRPSSFAGAKRVRTPFHDAPASGTLLGVSPNRVVPVIIVGARGRMGRALIQEVVGSDDLVLVGAVDRSGGPGIGKDAGELAGTTHLGLRVTELLSPRRKNVVVDFSLPETTAANIELCVEAGAPLVLGTTGLSPEIEALVTEASQQIPIVHAANYSVGLTVLTHLAEKAVRALGPEWDAELFELHHRHKRDAPSGTALRLGQSIARAGGVELDEVLVQGRAGLHTARKDRELGIASVRGGDSIGEHTVMFFSEGERIELTHRATERAIFARGALRAAHWLADREPNLYDMQDVLGIR